MATPTDKAGAEQAGLTRAGLTLRVAGEKRRFPAVSHEFFKIPSWAGVFRAVSTFAF
jgi:hypothetical protein